MLKVFRYCQKNREEIIPINGIFKVYEKDYYKLIYTSDSPITDPNVFLEDFRLDSSKFNIGAQKISTIKPENLFSDCFGFTSLKVNNETFSFNILIEKLKKNDAEDMLTYLWGKDRSLYNNFLSKSSSTASSTQDSEIYTTSKFLNYANLFYDQMLEYSQSFASLPYYVLRSKCELSNYSEDLINADSIPWILENLDAVSFDSGFRYDPDAIDFEGNYGVIDRLIVNKQYKCYNTYENGIILGGFLRLINKLNSLKREINNNIDTTKKYSDDNYVDFRDLKKIPYIHLKDSVNNIKYKIENLYIRYKNIFTDTQPKIAQPHLTPVFIGRRHYSKTFQLIQKGWNAKFDFKGDILLFNIQKMSHLYEIYNLYILLECIEKEVKSIGFKDYSQIWNNNTRKTTYKKDLMTINFYYEPSYSHNKDSEINLIRIDNRERANYFKPDFVLEFIFPGKDNIYCILDAKYSHSGIVEKRMYDCIEKYILKTGIYQNPYKKIDFLFILAPIDTKNEYVTNDLYYPQIGIIPSIPSNTYDAQKTISKIIETSYNRLLKS